MAAAATTTGVAGVGTTIGDAVTGNWGGAINTFIGLFNGHSNWYKADQALAATNWPAVAAFYEKFYSDPTFNSNGKNGFLGDLAGGIDGDLVSADLGAHVPRYTILAQVYKNTQDGNILQMYNAALQQGLITADPTVANLPTPAFTAASNPNTPGAASAAGATTVTNVPYTTVGTTGTTTTATAVAPTTIYLGIGIAAVVIIIIVLLFKKK